MFPGTLYITVNVAVSMVTESVLDDIKEEILDISFPEKR
jgi:hypothetical protein